MVHLLISAISSETGALFMGEPLSGNTISKNNNTPNLIKVLKADLKIPETLLPYPMPASHLPCLTDSVEDGKKDVDMDQKLFGRTLQNKVVVFPKKNYKKGDFVAVTVNNVTQTTLISK